MNINLKINSTIWIWTCFLGFISCSAPQELLKLEDPKNVYTHSGTEDFVLDSAKDQLRLLISCDERRTLVTQGEIWEMDLKTEKSRKLILKFNSEHIAFHPHGMSQFEDYLFVINHITDKEDEIIKFKIYADSLVQVSSYKDGFIGEANDVFATGVDEFYYTNFKIFGGSVIHYANGKNSKDFKRLRLPNGIIMIDNHLFVSETIGNRLFDYDVDTGKREKIARIKGGDNIMVNDNILYITAHTKFRSFMKHYKSSDNLSPSVVYQYDITSKELTQVYSENGEVISACATALVWNDQLYLSQVFENYITLFPLIK
jgi:hypothetical protein